MEALNDAAGRAINLTRHLKDARAAAIPCGRLGTSSTSRPPPPPPPVQQPPPAAAPQPPPASAQQPPPAHAQQPPLTAAQQLSLTAAPQPPLNAAALPTGRRTRRIFSLDGVIAEYDTVVQLVNSGLSKSAALEQINISRSQFSRKRCIAEAAKVDLPGVQHALLQLREVTLPNVYPFSSEICNRNLATLRTLYTQGVVLAPRDNYTAPPPPRRN